MCPYIPIWHSHAIPRKNIWLCHLHQLWKTKINFSVCYRNLNQKQVEAEPQVHILTVLGQGSQSCFLMLFKWWKWKNENIATSAFTGAFFTACQAVVHAMKDTEIASLKFFVLIPSKELKELRRILCCCYTWFTRKYFKNIFKCDRIYNKSIIENLSNCIVNFIAMDQGIKEGKRESLRANNR